MSGTGVLFVVNTIRKALQKSHLWISAVTKNYFQMSAFF